MAKALMIMDRCTEPGQFVKMSDLLAEHKYAIRSKDWGGDVMKLKYWGFLEAKAHAVREDGSPRAGVWRITPTGRAFARGEIDAPKFRYVYNSELVNRDNPDTARTWISECLGRAFDFRVLVDSSPDGSLPAKGPL
jgi:hypothetical protein